MAYSSAARPRKTPERGPKMVSNTYVVVGPKEVFGKRKGETFDATLTADQEAHLMEAGHIAVAPSPKPRTAVESRPAAESKEPKEKKGPSA